MESRQIGNRPDSAMKLATARLVRIRHAFGGDGLRLFSAAAEPARRLNWIRKAAAAAHSNSPSDPAMAAKNFSIAPQRVDRVRRQSRPDGRGLLDEAIAALSRFHHTLRLRSMADNLDPQPAKNLYSPDTTKRSLVGAPEVVFQSDEGIERKDLRAASDDSRRRSIDHITPWRNEAREGGMTSNAPRFKRRAAISQHALARTPTSLLAQSAHRRVSNAARTIGSLGATERNDGAEISESNRGRIKRALAPALNGENYVFTNSRNNAASLAARSDSGAADGIASATEPHLARTPAIDLVRRSPVGAIARLLQSTGLSSAGKKEAEPAAPSRAAMAEGSRVVVNFSPTFEIADGADQKRIEQAVADALASRIPEVLRRLRDEWANRRRVAFI